MQKNFCILEGGTWQGMGYFRAIWCFVSLERNPIRFAIVSILLWSGRRVGSCLRRWERGGQVRGPCAEGPGGGKTKSLCGAWGGPVGGCRALIKAWVRGTSFHCEACEDWRRTGLCRMLAGGSCCSSLVFSRRLFVNITVTMQNQEYFQIFTAIHQQPDEGGAAKVGGGGRPFFAVIWLDLPVVCGFVLLTCLWMECLQTFLISTLIK